MRNEKPMDHPESTTTNERRWLPWSAATLAVLVVSLMLLGNVPAPGASMSGLSPSNARSAAIGSPMGTHLGLAASGAPSAAPPLAAPTYTTTTSGTFFTSTGVALPSLSSRPCSVPLTAGVCKASASFTSGTTSVAPYVNASNDPALNLTSKGILAMAYTSYTTSASCAAKSAWTDSQIAFATSSNNGASWSTISYLGTPDCASAAKYPSSWQPALTSLANGTLVLAYIQYNSTAPGVAPFFTSPPLSRLVVSLSYSNGASWTQPSVVNVSNPDPSLTVSFPPMRPSITAFGKTIYLTWMNLGSTVFPQVVSHVAMVVSTTGGKSWSPTITLDSATSYSANPNVAVNPTTGQLYVTFDQPVNYCGVGYFCPGYPGLSTGSPYSTNVVFATSTANGTGMTYSTVAFGVRINQTYGPFFNPAPVLAYGAKWKVLDLAFVGGVTPGSGGGTTGAQDGDLYFYSSTSNGLSWSRSSTASSAVYSPSLVWGGLTNSTQILSIGVTPMYSSNLWLTATVFNGTLCAQTSCGVVENVALNTSNNGTTWSTALNTSSAGGKWLSSGPFVQSPYVMGNGTNGSYRAYLTGEYDSAISYGSTMLFAWANATCPSWTTSGSLTPSIGECGSFTGSSGSPSWTLWGTSTIQLSQVYTGASTAVTFTPSILPGAAIYHLFVMGNEFRGNGSTSVVVSNVPTGEWVYFNYSGPGPWNATTEFVHGSSSPASPKVFTSATTVSLPFQELVPVVVNTAPSWLGGRDCSVPYTGFGCPLYYSPYTSAVVGSVGWPGPLAYPSSDLDPYGCYFNYCYNPLTGAFTYNGPAQFTCAAYLYPLSMFSSTEAGYEYEYLACVNAYVTHNTGSGSNWQTGSPIPYGSTAWAPVGKPYALNVSYWSPWNVLCGQNKPPYPPGLRANSGSSGFWLWELYCYGGDFNELVANAWFGTGPGSVTTQIAPGGSGDIVVTPTGGAPVTETVDWKVNQECTLQFAYFEQYGYGSSGSVYSYSYNSTTCHAPSGGGGGGVQVPLTINETGLPKGVTWGVSLSGGGKTFNNTAKGSVLNFPQLIAGTTYTVSVNTVPDPLTGLYWVGTTNATVTMPDFNGITV
ncbi:MAG TPA: hypothetical protein VGS18_04180, partial [Thermoplasmata archaeon]|nr:hypothetical protein [Thermoplasmata archaeon]